VGVGIAPNMITLEAIEEIKKAEVVYGSKRALELASPYINGKAFEIKDYKKLHEIPKNAVVLSTGDPMFSGLGYLGDEVVCGISSMQVACARLKIRHENVAMFTVHGRERQTNILEDMIKEVEMGRTLVILPNKEMSPAHIGRFLSENGYELRMALCENLGYPNERIRLYTTSSCPETEISPLTVVVIGFK